MIFFPATSWLTAEVDFYTIEVENTSTHFLLLSIYLYIQSKGRRLEIIWASVTVGMLVYKDTYCAYCSIL